MRERLGQDLFFLEDADERLERNGTSLRSGNPNLHPLGRNDFRFAPALTFEPVTRFLEDLHERPLLLRGVKESRDGVLRGRLSAP